MKKAQGSVILLRFLLFSSKDDFHHLISFKMAFNLGQTSLDL